MTKTTAAALTHLDAIHLMDCREGLRRIPAGSVDLVITDPPFAIDFKAKRSNYNRIESRVLDGYKEISVEDYAMFSHEWLLRVWECLKPSGSAYVFSGWNNLKDILIALDDIGFTTVNHIIWKYQFGVVTKRKYVTSHYHCLYVCKNDRLRKFFPFSRHGKDDRHESGGSAHYKDKEDVWVIKR